MHNDKRTCVFSQRYLQRQLSACCDYAFEEVLCEIDSIDLLEPQPTQRYAVRRKISNRLAQHASLSVNPGIKPIELKGQYDLFFVKCLLPIDLLSLNALKKWRQRCKIAVCWLAEVWAAELLAKWKTHIKILSQFDYIILNCSASVEPVHQLTGRPCFYLPPAVDAIMFCPYPDPPARSVDVYSIGRKSRETHNVLLQMAEQKKIFYIYDTIFLKETFFPIEHRRLIANIAKRSRYFLVAPGKFNCPYEIQGQHEIGFRFFEGAAAGTVMLGEAPKTKVFEENFDWTDAVIYVPLDSSKIAETMEELDAQPERIQEARKNNVVQSLLRHDWVYRWKSILDIAGLEPLKALTEREERLRQLAEVASKA